MKKIRVFSAALCLFLVTVCALTACGKKTISGTVALDKETAVVALGETLTLSATFTPEDETADVSGVVYQWSTSRTSIATVNENGVVTAKNPGKATITVSCEKATATCEVMVYDPESREVVELENSQINISVNQDKMTIGLRKAFGYLFEDGDVLLEIKDESGANIPFTTEGTTITVDWTGSVGMHKWVFLTNDMAITAEVCNATHILSRVSDYGPLSADWDVAVAGNTNNDPAHQNATKDWYVVLDANLDLGMALRDTEEYTFGREYSPGTYNAPNRKLAVFNGVFDGRGHVIKNMHTRQGFICNLGPTGVIKNVAFVQCRNGEGIPYYDCDGGFLGHCGLGTVENVFIDAFLYYEDGTASAMYCHSNDQSPLRVKNCLVMFYKKPGAENWGWPNGYRLPGAFCTYGAPQITNSYAISAHFTRADGNSDTSSLVYPTYDAWLAANKFGTYKGLWEISEKNIFFGGERVFTTEKE